MSGRLAPKGAVPIKAISLLNEISAWGMTVRHYHSGSLMRFRDFIKRPPIQEAVAINTSAGSFVALDGSRSTEDRQSIIGEFGGALKELSGDGLGS